MNHVGDRTKLRRLQGRILSRKGLVCCGSEYTAALHSLGKAVFVGANRYGQGDVTACDGLTFLASTSTHIVALMKDGTLRLPTSADPRLSELAHVRSVSCSETHVAALLGNGSVVVGGNETGGRPYTADTSDWSAVVDVVCGKRFTAGLTPDGRVLLAGGTPRFRHTVHRWRDVAGLFADLEGETLYAVTVDGCLLSTSRLPRSVRAWRNLIFVAASGKRIMGVNATGRILATFRSPTSTNDTDHFVVCAVSTGHAVALTRDGHVCALGKNQFGQCDTERFGVLFESFDELVADRTASVRRIIAHERDYQMRLVEAARYGKRMLCGSRMSACIAADSRVLTSHGFGEAKHWTAVRALACGNAHLVALHEGGAVSADGNDTDGCTAVSDWKSIKCIAAGRYHTLGVTEDGRVLFCGRNDQGQGDVDDWSGIRCVYAADDYTVGLGYDGTLRIAGRPPFDPKILSENWNNPVDVVATSTHMAALYPNGRVLSTVMIPTEEKPGEGQTCDTGHFYRIRTIAAGEGFTVGLGYGGRVTAAGMNARVIETVKTWSDVVSLSCGRNYVLGLTANGRVLAAGTLRVERKTADALDPSKVAVKYAHQAPDTKDWRDVLALTAGPDHALAMTREGTILATGLDGDGQCAATTHFTLFRDTRQLYGYGRYRKVSECALYTPLVDDEQAEISGEEPTVTPFARFAPHLRADTEAILACLSGDDHYLTVCPMDGDSTRAITYCYETAERTEEIGKPSVMPSACAGHRASIFDEKWKDAVSVVTSEEHTVALFADGHVEAEGTDQNGECRTETWYHVIQIAVMPELTLGLRADGKVLAAGRHHTVLNTLDTVRAIACFGDRRQVFVMADGSIRIHVRGSEFLPEPLDICVFTPSVERSVLQRYTPHDVAIPAARRSISGSFALGMVHGLALNRKTGITVMGVDDSGQCGIVSYGDVVQIAAGPYHSAAILADGSIVASGRSPDGRCAYRVLNRELDTTGISVDDARHGANSAPASSASPSRIWLQVACGHEHTVALRSDGRVFAVGANPDGRCDTRKWRDVQYVACGVRHTVALRTDGTCVATGDNRYGQCDLSLWKNIVMVAAGEFHTVGLRADGRVEVAGDNRKGQCHTEDLRDIVWVTCSPEATLCVRADGRVIIRGGDGDMDKTVESLREVVALHACEHRIASLTVDRRVIILP